MTPAAVAARLSTLVESRLQVSLPDVYAIKCPAVVSSNGLSSDKKFHRDFVFKSEKGTKSHLVLPRFFVRR